MTYVTLLEIQEIKENVSLIIKFLKKQKINKILTNRKITIKFTK
jgi:hypothetical protein